MDETTWSIVNTLTIASAAILACIALWRAYTKRVDDHITDLRQANKDAEEMRRREIADLRARVMVIEDSLNITRSDRLKYLPTTKMPGGSEMADFDLDGDNLS